MSNEVTGSTPCKKFFNSHKPELAALARETIEEGYAPNEFVLVCIDAKDPDSKLITQHLVAEYGAEHQNSDPDVVLCAMSTEDTIAVFTQLIPSITAKIATTQYPEDAVRIIVIHGINIGFFVEELDDADTQVPAGIGGHLN